MDNRKAQVALALGAIVSSSMGQSAEPVGASGYFPGAPLYPKAPPLPDTKGVVGPASKPAAVVARRAKNKAARKARRKAR